MSMKQFDASRRGFLRAAALGAGFSALAPVEGALAAGPPVRNGASHMKLSLAAYSFRDFMAKRGTAAEVAAAEMRLENFVDLCAGLGLDGTELTSYYFPKDVTRDYLLSLKQQAFRLGLSISGTAIGNDFCHPPGAERDAELAMTREWIDHAAVMGAPVIRIFAGSANKGEPEETAIQRCVDGINESLAYAAEKGVFLALENHGGITATPAQMLRIIEGVDDSPWFGVNFDSGNFNTDDPYRDLAVIAPYAVNAQIKVKIRRNDVREETDFPRVIGILKDAGYRGYIVLEYEEENPKEAVPRYIDILRELLVR